MSTTDQASSVAPKTMNGATDNPQPAGKPGENPGEKSGEKPGEHLGESEFLQQEADRAKAAIAESLAAFGRSLGRAADPHRLTQDHPYIAVGVAAVAGFAAAASLVPSKQQQTFKTLAAIERSLRHPTETSNGSKEKAEPDKKSGSPISGFLGIILAEVFKLLRPLLTTLVTNAVSGDDNAQSGNHDGTDRKEPISGEAPGIPSPS